MAHRNPLATLSSPLALSLLLVLAGCGDFESAFDPRDDSWRTSDQLFTAQVVGSVGDGPIVGATLQVFSNSGKLLMTTSSDSTADYSLSIRTQGRNYPLTIVADGGTDIVTFRPPDFKLVTTVMKPGNGQTVNLNPYSTLIVKAAQNAGGITEENVAKATEAVVSRYGFGLDPAVLPDPLFTRLDDSNVHLIVKASETMGEMIRRVRDAMTAAGTYVDGNDVVRALSADLVDGWVDGRGADGYDRRIAAVANVASAAVMVEAMANRLHVYDIDATRYMDNAIRQVRPNAPASSNTRNVPIPEDALVQSLRSLRAAKVVKNDPRITEIYDLVAGAKPGTTEFDALSSGIQTMSTGFHNPLNDAVLATAFLAEEAKLDKINSREGTGTDPGDDRHTDNTETGDTGTPDSDNTATDQPLQEGSTDTGTGGGSSGTDSGGGSNDNGDTSSDPDAVPNDGEQQVDDPAPGILWKNDGWLQFDGGERSLLNTGLSLAELSSTSFTVEAMVQYTGTTSRTWTPIFGANAHPESFFVGKRRDTDELSIYISGLGSYVVNSHGLFDGQERHLALVFDDVADEFRVFVDRVLIATRTGVAGTLTSTSDLLIAGVAHATDERWVGWIGPHRVTNQALSSNAFLGNDGEPVALRPNRAPTISGTPQTALVVGTPWNFKPTASDPDGDPLTFSLKQQPEWASFNTQTGEISGTPTTKGSHPDIVITVSDGRTETALSAFTLQVDEPTLGTATVSWQPPTTRTDGSALTDLAGYRVYYGKDKASLTHVVEITKVGQTSQFIGNLDKGSWYFAVTAICSQGLESPKSEIGSKTIL